MSSHNQRRIDIIERGIPNVRHTTRFAAKSILSPMGAISRAQEQNPIS
jgi:hypothetical protein